VNRTQATQTIVLVTCVLLVISYFAPMGIYLKAQPEEKWVAHPLYISPDGGSATPQGYYPSQIRTAYNLPTWGGNGTTIAIIDAYDTPNILTNFNTFSNQYGLPDNRTGNFLVHKMAQNMQTNSEWALETCLDVEWAHAIAPNATILLVEAVNNTDIALLSAIDYATKQPGVVAVSMSWGGDERPAEGSPFYENHFNKPGITFFASSGDDGSSVLWPAASASVVSVGGTTLNLNPDGTVISEVAWQNSSGGISEYVARPAYQSSFGLIYSNRAVPDVSYNGNASTGVAVYNGTWRKMGGTSAGAPQWAAIHALGLSASNTNLYNQAKSAYSSYFRDITVGSNYADSTTTGYDLVTGLGSPLTTNFSTEITISPTEGPPNGLVTLSGTGFAQSSSANISYRNPINSLWLQLVSNLTITSDTFSFSFNAPDLLQNNTEGDSQPQFENIVFRVVDNNNRLYATTVPYTEWRRGIVQIGDATALGLYGNNTNLATSVFVKNGDLVPFSGKWFVPGNLSVFWDNTLNLDSITTDDAGFFNTTITMPTLPAGQHTITLSDGAANFSLNITRLPSVSDDYVDVWHTSDFTINLAPDYAVNETFYRINDGPIFNVTANGQPEIATEDRGNKLEYWSIWDLYGTGVVELPHIILPEIKLDKTRPTGSITPSNTNVNSPTIMLWLSAADDVSAVAQMRFSNGNSDWSAWEPYQTSKTWVLPNGDGAKTINVQFIDDAGIISQIYNSTVNLTTPIPTPSPTDSPTIKPAATAAPFTTTTPSNDQTESPTIQPTPTIPELNFGIALVVLAVCTLALTLIYGRKQKQRKFNTELFN
jgi:hypothetical protein